MEQSFEAMAADLRELLARERALLRAFGSLPSQPEDGFLAAWRRGLDRASALVDVLVILAPHERTVRSLDPRLARRFPDPALIPDPLGR